MKIKGLALQEEHLLELFLEPKLANEYHHSSDKSTQLTFSDFYIDEGCCQMFNTEPNCLDQCLKIIKNESIFEFTRDLFACASRNDSPRVCVNDLTSYF